MSGLIDRRVSPRIFCDLWVDYEARGARAQLGRIINLGTAGACLTTQGAIPPVGADLLLCFHFPLRKRPIEAMGHVRWVTRGTAGVEFGQLGPQAQNEIWRYYAKESAWQRGGGVRSFQPSGRRRDLEVFRDVLEAWRRHIRESDRPREDTVIKPGEA